MDITVTERGKVIVIALVGSLDAPGAETVGNILGAQIKAGHTRLVADVGQVEFISSVGLRTLVQTLKDTRRKGGDFRLANARANVHRVLDLTGFVGLFKTYPDIEAAVASFTA
jgi:anti-anti-sigma factor